MNILIFVFMYCSVRWRSFGITSCKVCYPQVELLSSDNNIEKTDKKFSTWLKEKEKQINYKSIIDEKQEKALSAKLFSWMIKS